MTEKIEITRLSSCKYTLTIGVQVIEFGAQSEDPFVILAAAAEALEYTDPPVLLDQQVNLIGGTTGAQNQLTLNQLLNELGSGDPRGELND